MTELRSLLLEAEPLDDAGFLTGSGVRSIAAGRTRRRRVVAVSSVLVAVLVAAPFALRPTSGELPPVAPAPNPTAPPSATRLLETFEGTEWRVDLRASGITVDPRVAPTVALEGSGATGLGTIVLLDDDGGLRLRNGYGSAAPLSAGRNSGYLWERRSADGNSGWISFTITAPDWYAWGTGAGTESVSCGPDYPCPKEYWPGVRALSRLESVVGYELLPVPAGGALVPPGPTIGMRLLDVRGDVVLRLVLVAQDGEPVGDA